MDNMLCACGCGRQAEEGSSYYDEETCGFGHNPNDAPYENED